MDASSSPRPTPNIEDAPRFVNIADLPDEWEENYLPGGLHPVHLGDVLNEQYTVIRKLSVVQFSTVWLARDRKNRRYVAIKILASMLSEDPPELKIGLYLNRSGAESEHVVRLLDEFIVEGPNGRHACLVYEPMGPSTSRIVVMPGFPVRKWDDGIGYPLWMTKGILKQTLQGLAFLHSRGVGHGEFHSGKFLFGLDNLDSVPENELRQPEVEDESILPRVRRLDGKPDRWAPRYLCFSQPLLAYTNVRETFRIKLADLTGAYLFDDPAPRMKTPPGLRPPELILAGNDLRSVLGPALDVWAFGCLVYTILARRPLFYVSLQEFDNDAQRDDAHLHHMTSLLGHLPDNLYSKWENRRLYYTEDRTLYNVQIGGDPAGREPLMLEQFTIEEEFDKAETDLDDEEAVQVKTLLRRILRLDPAERPSAEELLQDPFLR